MDLYDELLNKAKETAEQMRAKGKATTTDRADDGQTVEGWVVHCFTSYSNEKRHGNWFRENWGNSHIILSTDGRFFTYNFDGEEQSGKQQQLTHRIKPTEQYELLNLGKGKPFSEAIRLLEYLPYKS